MSRALYCLLLVFCFTLSACQSDLDESSRVYVGPKSPDPKNEKPKLTACEALAEANKCWQDGVAGFRQYMGRKRGFKAVLSRDRTKADSIDGHIHGVFRGRADLPRVGRSRPIKPIGVSFQLGEGPWFKVKTRGEWLTDKHSIDLHTVDWDRRLRYSYNNGSVNLRCGRGKRYEFADIHGLNCGEIPLFFFHWSRFKRPRECGIRLDLDPSQSGGYEFEILSGTGRCH